MDWLVDVQIVRESRACAQKCFGLSNNTIDFLNLKQLTVELEF